MKLTPLGIDGAWLAESDIHADNRGTFREWFKSEEIKKVTGTDFFVNQANISISNRGVIRGIHYSLAEVGQAKWVTCASGHIVDVIADIRSNSPTFKKVVEVDLKNGDGRAVLIGKGLGHGFLALEDNSVVSYLLSSPFSPHDEFEINPLDEELAINWEIDGMASSDFIISEKDLNSPSLSHQQKLSRLPN